MKDDIWEAFDKSAGTAYVAYRENAITLCSSGFTAADALRQMAELVSEYLEPIILATNYYLDDDRYYMTVIISGYREEF